MLVICVWTQHAEIALTHPPRSISLSPVVLSLCLSLQVPESALLDLKHLLVEAKQRVPPVLQALQDPDADLAGMGGTQGCAFCGGLGHRITECPKLEKTASRLAGGKKDSLAGADGY